MHMGYINTTMVYKGAMVIEQYIAGTQRNNNAIGTQALDKAPAIDIIPPQLSKHRTSALSSPFHSSLCRWWKKNTIPKTKDATAIALHKNKGSSAGCNNCRGVSLPSIVGTVVAALILATFWRLTGLLMSVERPAAICAWYVSIANFWKRPERKITVSKLPS